MAFFTDKEIWKAIDNKNIENTKIIVNAGDIFDDLIN